MGDGEHSRADVVATATFCSDWSGGNARARFESRHIYEHLEGGGTWTGIFSLDESLHFFSIAWRRGRHWVPIARRPSSDTDHLLLLQTAALSLLLPTSQFPFSLRRQPTCASCSYLCRRRSVPTPSPWLSRVGKYHVSHHRRQPDEDRPLIKPRLRTPVQCRPNVSTTSACE
jgi:hypothetical protein